jgi:hypothetical protein
MPDWNKEGPRLLAAVKAITTHPHITLGDLVYEVREQEGEGWDGPGVKAWGDAVTELDAAVKAAEAGAVTGEAAATASPAFGMDWRLAREHLKVGKAVYRPSWSANTRIAMSGGEIRIFRGSACGGYFYPRPEETSATDWLNWE